ncbi:MAG: flagellar export chaperone FliS [Gemmatimonadota bacterium]
MSYAAQAGRYREAEVLSASPGQLVMLIYDHLLVNLRRARLLMGHDDLVTRSEALERARAALTELLVSLDRNNGHEVAERLASLYAFMLGELSVLGVRPDGERLDAVISMVGELRHAFRVAARATPGNLPAIAAS